MRCVRNVRYGRKAPLAVTHVLAGVTLLAIVVVSLTVGESKCISYDEVVLSGNFSLILKKTFLMVEVKVKNHFINFFRLKILIAYSQS